MSEETLSLEAIKLRLESQGERNVTFLSNGIIRSLKGRKMINYWEVENGELVPIDSKDVS